MMNYMKIALFYFSGTGNTKTVVFKWQEEALKHNINIDLFEIEKDELPSLADYDKVGFAYPIHAFNAPEIVWRFALKLPTQEKAIPLFIIMVSGEYMTINHSSASKLRRILRKKNYQFESDYHYVMPYNLVFRHTEQRAYRMYEAMTKIVPIDVKEYLVDSIPHQTRKHHLVGWFIFLLRIEQWFSGVNGRFYKVDMKKCIKCMKCVNACPVHNIEFKDNKFIFHDKCLLCERCSFHCPKDAFKIALLNLWRVNKPYQFKDVDKDEKDRHSLYCKRSYKRYFKEIEERVSSYESRSGY